jgi:translation initiation factor 2B subunit (eIF-2B alpha/beta/delta family)
MPNVPFHLTIMESRPRCEGADMAARIYASAPNRRRLSIRMIPDCTVGTVSRHIDIVLLGADRISSTGDVSNKIGSLAAALCARHWNQEIAVVAISDIDKIAPPGLEVKTIETHPAHELSSAWAPDTRHQLVGQSDVEVFGEWFEWIPANLVDVYITELGVLSTDDVATVAKEIGDLNEYIFQGKEK